MTNVFFHSFHRRIFFLIFDIHGIAFHSAKPFFVSSKIYNSNVLCSAITSIHCVVFGPYSALPFFLQSCFVFLHPGVYRLLSTV